MLLLVDQGATPLWYAAKDGNVEIVKLLLGAGADRSAKDNQGKTALEQARSSYHDEVVALLE